MAEKDGPGPLEQIQQEQRPLDKGDTRTGVNQCRICHRTYERADHLSRHMRSHENARSFRCEYCAKSFNRGDLLNRHVQGHQKAANAHTRSVPRRPVDRVGKACDSCAASKARCDNEKPCQRCRNKGLPCDTSSLSVQEKSQDPEPSNQQETGQSPQLQYLSQDGSSLIDASFQSDSQLRCSLIQDAGEDGPQAGIFQHHPTVSFSMDSVPMSSMPTEFDDIMQDLPYLASEFNNQVFDTDIYDFDFSNDEFEFMTAGLGNAMQGVNSEQVDSDNSPSVRDASRGHAAFIRSPWLWTPAKEDRLVVGHDSLALDESSITSPLTHTPEYDSLQAMRGTVPSIRSIDRDKMLYLVSAMRSYTTGTPSFPSLDILNYLVEAFFARQRNEIDTWVHPSAISLAQNCPEFLVALVSAGSTVISVPAIWKMGLVMQDIVRVTIGDLWERDNKKTRDLQPLQAWLMSLDTGLWSGYQRPMEIAESFLQPLTTMMRRGGVFSSALSTQSLLPTATDEGVSLETKWRKWVEVESFKRLSIQTFVHDARASIALQKSHLISPNELTLQVPIARALFQANSAFEWKSTYLSIERKQSIQPLPKLIDACRDSSILNDVQDWVDIDACHMAILYGHWQGIWAFRESSAFHSIGDNRVSVQASWLPMQQRELGLQLEEFKDRLLQSVPQRPELILTAELLLMILYISPEELQIFAGKGGEEAASRILPVLETWSSSEQGRRAVWHAAQVFRSAAELSPTSLRDFCAIAVYFASLTMWTYGHLSPKPSPAQQLLEIAQRPPFIMLNGEETRETRAFITRGTGSCFLTKLVPHRSPENSESSTRSNSTSVSLSDPNGILSMARDLYRNNFPVIEEPLPALVHNMGNLMRDLTSLPDSRFSRCPSPEGSRSR